MTTTRSGASQYRRAGSGRVSASGREEDFCLLGVDSFNRDGERDSVRLGLVVKMLWGTEIIMDGDGGFRVVVTSRQLMFKPACLQQLWTTLQLLHSIIASLRPHKACVEERDEVRIITFDKISDEYLFPSSGLGPGVPEESQFSPIVYK